MTITNQAINTTHNKAITTTNHTNINTQAHTNNQDSIHIPIQTTHRWECITAIQATTHTNNIHNITNMAANNLAIQE